MSVEDKLRQLYPNISPAEVQGKLRGYALFHEDWELMKLHTPSKADSARYLDLTRLTAPIRYVTYEYLARYGWYYRDCGGWAQVQMVLEDNDTEPVMDRPTWAATAALPHYFHPWMWDHLYKRGVRTWSDLKGKCVVTPARRPSIRVSLQRILQIYGIRVTVEDFCVSFNEWPVEAKELVALRSNVYALFTTANIDYIESVYHKACQEHKGVEVFWCHGKGLAIRRRII